MNSSEADVSHPPTESSLKCALGPNTRKTGDRLGSGSFRRPLSLEMVTFILKNIRLSVLFIVEGES